MKAVNDIVTIDNNMHCFYEYCFNILYPAQHYN